MIHRLRKRPLIYPDPTLTLSYPQLSPYSVQIHRLRKRFTRWKRTVTWLIYQARALAVLPLQVSGGGDDDEDDDDATSFRVFVSYLLLLSRPSVSHPLDAYYSISPSTVLDHSYDTSLLPDLTNPNLTLTLLPSSNLLDFVSTVARRALHASHASRRSVQRTTE